MRIPDLRPRYQFMIGTRLRVPRAAAMRRSSKGTLFAFACLALVSCEPAVQHVPPPIRIASYQWPGSYWIDIAWKKGWFAEAGLNVERVDVNLKYFKSLDEVASGKLDVMGFSQFDLVQHVAAGNDLVGIAAVDYSVGAEALVARPGIHGL